MLAKRGTLALVAAALLFGPPVRPTPSTSEQGSICVQPVPVHSSFMLCQSGKLSLSVDNGQSIPWPHENPRKIDGLDLTRSHRLVTRCGGKPVQAATFRFSEYQSKELCLVFDTMFDGYEGMRLWDARHASWCKKCK
jgi:hypothetical protein